MAYRVYPVYSYDGYKLCVLDYLTRKQCESLYGQYYKVCVPERWGFILLPNTKEWLNQIHYIDGLGLQGISDREKRFD